MTTPTTAQQQPVQQPQQQPVQQPDDDALAAAAAVALAAGVTVTGVTTLLMQQFGRAGVERLALQSAVQVVMSMPPEVTGIAGPATTQMAYLNQVRRGQMVLAIGRRLTSDVKRARSRGESIGRALLDGVSRETRYFALHRDAMWSRAKAAMAVDMAALQYGLLLGWYAHLDDRTTPECADADGKNFRADSMPLIGYPGAVHGSNCRCLPGAPYPGAPVLPSASNTPPHTVRLQRRLGQLLGG